MIGRVKLLYTALLLLLVFTNHQTFAQNSLKVGDLATDFSLKDVNGQPVSFDSFPNAKGFIIVFTSNQCVYAKLYQERIKELNNKFLSQGYPLIAINSDVEKQNPLEVINNMKKTAISEKFSFPYLHDENQLIAKSYGVQTTPQIFIVQKQKKGNIIAYIGAIDNDVENISPNASTKYVETALLELLENKKVLVTQTTSTGCAIN